MTLNTRNQSFDSSNIPADEQPHEADTGPIILWSSAILGGIAILGLVLWSQAGSAVFFDRISGAIAGCF
jgi:hypothetical protein